MEQVQVQIQIQIQILKKQYVLCHFFHEDKIIFIDSNGDKEKWTI